MTKRPIIVSTDWHEFVGDEELCGGVLGRGRADWRFGGVCKRPRDAQVHSDERGMQVMADDIRSKPANTQAPAPYPSETFRRIVEERIPEWIEYFREKNAHYTSRSGFEPHKLLGEAGQFSDIWRKIWPLKKAMWDGEKLELETKEVIIMDLIGHLFLTLDMLDQEDGGPGPCLGKRD